MVLDSHTAAPLSAVDTTRRRSVFHYRLSAHARAPRESIGTFMYFLLCGHLFYFQHTMTFENPRTLRLSR